MKTKKYKVLFYGNLFVDEAQLINGLYSTLTPNLREENTTIEHLIEESEDILKDLPYLSQYIHNLKQCELKEVTLQY